MTVNRTLCGFMVASLLLLQACGGGGGGGETSSGVTYGGATTEATLDSDNAEDLARAAASGSKQSVSSESAPPVMLRSGADTKTQLKDLAATMIQAFGEAPAGAARGGTQARTVDYSTTFCPAGGSATASVPDSATSTNYSFSVAFSDCMTSASGMTYTYSGTVQGSSEQDASGFSFSIAFIDFTVTVTGAHTMSSTLNLTMSCSGTDTAGYTDAVCTYHSDFVGLDGRVYRVTDATVSGDDSGYTISVIVYHPNHGYVTVTTSTPITFQCDGGYPDSGTLVLTGSGGGTATVNFINCGEYQVTYDSVTTLHSW